MACYMLYIFCEYLILPNIREVHVLQFLIAGTHCWYKSVEACDFLDNMSQYTNQLCFKRRNMFWF